MRRVDEPDVVARVPPERGQGTVLTGGVIGTSRCNPTLRRRPSLPERAAARVRAPSVATSRALGLPLSQSLRAIERERGPAALLFVGALAALLGAWTAWLAFGSVELRATSVRARVEVDHRIFRVDAPVAGTIARISAVLGRPVEAGEVLVELDSSVERRRIDEEKVRLGALDTEIGAVRKILDAYEAVIREDEGATRVAVREGQALEQEKRTAATQAEEEARRAGVLRDGGAIAEIDFLRSRTEADKQRAATEALGLGIDRIRGEMRTRASGVRARLEELRRELTMLQGRRETTDVAIRTLEADIARRTVRAPVAGTIGELAELNAGAFVEGGARICTVLPKGDLRIVAELAPRDATGRVRSGQSAIVRLDAFPWVEFGTVPATVSRVASEPRDGLVRVELVPHLDENRRIALEHGMTAVTEIAVERVSPATLALRVSGASLDAPKTER